MRNPKKWPVAIILVAAAMCVCFVVLCTSSPAKVMTEADFADGSHIYMINADGSGFMQLDDVENDPFVDFLFMEDLEILALAEDGSKVAFAHEKTRIGKTDIYVADLNSTDFTQIASGDGVECYFLPDFSKVACRGGVEDIDGHMIEGILYIMDVDGSNKTTFPGQGEFPLTVDSCIWSPDGGKVACIVWEYIITVINADNSNQTWIVSNADEHYPVSSLKWSPDCINLYYLENGGLFVAGADGTGLNKLADNIDHYDMSPDGRHIIYWTDDNVIYMMNADGSNKVELSDATVHSSFKWSPDGSEIAYIVTVEDDYYGHLYVMNADGSNQRKLTGYEDAGVVLYQWSPNSSRIYYLRRGNISNINTETPSSMSDYKTDIYVTSTDRKYFAKLTDYWDDERYLVYGFQLSPDGEKLPIRFIARNR